MTTSATTPAGRTAPPQALGLRERKRARVRRELIDAAGALFAERGFDAVTVDEIAEAADVAPRTFYRYFPVKEDVAIADLQEGNVLMVEELGARPPEEPPLVALREAMRAPAARLAEEKRLCATMKMMGSSQSLMAHEMATRAWTVDEVTRLLRERMGADDADIRPRVIAASVMAGVSVAVRSWIQAGAGAQEDLDARVDVVMALLGDGLEGVT